MILEALELNEAAKLNKVVVEQLESHKKLTRTLEGQKQNLEQEKLQAIISKVLSNEAQAVSSLKEFIS